MTKRTYGCFTLILFLYIFSIIFVFFNNIWHTNWNSFVSLFKDPGFYFSLRLSIITSVLTTGIAVVFGIPSAYVLSRFNFWGKPFFEILLALPIALPASQLGLSLLTAFDTPLGVFIQKNMGLSFVYSQKGIILAQLILAVSFGVNVWKGAFSAVDGRCEQVSRTLGASYWKTFLSITLPQAKNGLIAGAILAWARALGEYGAVLVFCGAFRGKTDTIPLSIFLNVSEGNIETAIALCFILAFVSIISIISIRKIGYRTAIW